MTPINCALNIQYVTQAAPRTQRLSLNEDIFVFKAAMEECPEKPECPKKPRGQRGKRSEAATAERHTTQVLPSHPTEFLHGARTSQRVTDYMASSSLRPLDLPLIDGDDNRNIVLHSGPPTSKELANMGPGGIPLKLTKKLWPAVRAALAKLGLSNVLVIRRVKQIPLRPLDVLCGVFRKIVALGFVATEQHGMRSDSPGLHAGVWEPYRKQACIAADA
ncbi:hypothetical protein GGX14DRAFT_398348 [Mycena pura]|uniref:Uncharacterized protein n=1 Tax=Mycena pura TaxID=153505 RepID=A0AAD6VA65_9AGAR|nr:hypothetical protein GGX14DRAFT_398348 [Mycena pura]